MQYLGTISKTTEWSLFPRQIIQYHSNPSLYPNNQCWRSWSWTVLWRPTWPSRTNSKKECPSHHRRLEYKSMESRDIWRNRQTWPWITKWSKAKGNRVFPREGTGHSKHPLATIQEKALNVSIIRWFIPKSDWLYSLWPKMEKFYTVSKNKTRSWLWLRSWKHYCQIET